MRNQRRPFIVLSIIASFACGAGARAEPHAAAHYNPANGVMYLYATARIGLIGFDTDATLDEGVIPLLGGRRPNAFDYVFPVFFWVDVDLDGLPAGLFALKPTPFPAGLPPDTYIGFAYSVIGEDSNGGPLEPFAADPAASAIYNPATGEIVVDVARGAQALLLESPGRFLAGAQPRLGALAAKQFDADNLMFFNDDNPLPIGQFSLGRILPPGLSAAEISLATKSNGIAAGIPVTVVPEPASVAIALITAVARVASRSRWGSNGKFRMTQN